MRFCKFVSPRSYLSCTPRLLSLCSSVCPTVQADAIDRPPVAAFAPLLLHSRLSTLWALFSLFANRLQMPRRVKVGGGWTDRRCGRAFVDERGLESSLDSQTAPLHRGAPSSAIVSCGFACLRCRAPAGAAVTFAPKEYRSLGHRTGTRLVFFRLAGAATLRAELHGGAAGGSGL